MKTPREPSSRPPRTPSSGSPSGSPDERSEDEGAPTLNDARIVSLDYLSNEDPDTNDETEEPPDQSVS